MSRARFAAFIVAAAVAPIAVGCETPKSYVEIPACADRIEMQGQARRLSAHRFELDHTLDLPFSRTRLEFSDGARTTRTFDVTSDEPDPLRSFVGAGSGVVGVLLVGAAVYDLENGRGLFEERPFYETLFGTAFIGLGAAAVSTGWHPAQELIEFPDDVCPANGANGAGAAGGAGGASGRAGDGTYER